VGGTAGVSQTNNAACASPDQVEGGWVNHGLVHYYFGSNENLLVYALERFTGRLITRQRELYAADLPFADKWRTTMRYLVGEDDALRP
jgi:AcrR family transcriptional regulator